MEKNEVLNKKFERVSRKISGSEASEEYDRLGVFFKKYR